MKLPAPINGDLSRDILEAIDIRTVQAVLRQPVIQEMAGRHHLRRDLSATTLRNSNGGEPWTLKQPLFTFYSRPEHHCTPELFEVDKETMK